MEGLNWQKHEFSFSAGLNQKANAQLVEGPDLTLAVNVEFDELGGLRLRKPYASIGANIFGGGTLSNTRRVYAYGDELVLFTKDALYSWSAQRSAWVRKGTHLAIKVDEEPTFINTSNQDDADRAEHGGTVVYCWRQTITGVDEIFVAAQDATTGAVLLAPTDVAPGTRPRVVATATNILLFYENATGSLVSRTIDTSTLAISGTTTVLAAANFSTYYDVEKIPNVDSVMVVTRRDVTTSYSVITVTSALGITATTQAYTCDGPIAIGFATDGAFVVARANGLNIRGEVFDPGGSVASDDRALGSGSTTINQITLAWPSTTLCQVFWHSNQATNATAFEATTNTVATSGVVGTSARLAYRLGLASRAFAHDGAVYVWTVFAGESSFSGSNPPEFRAQLQNTYFLYRADGLLCAKAAWQRAAGFRTTGLLPGITASGTAITFCGGERRVIPIGEAIEGTGTVKDGTTRQSAYADTGPREVTVTFDSDEARRVAKLGQTLYISGGEIMQYDGRSLVEVGFHLYPHYFGSIEVGTGNLTDGVYTLKNAWRYENAKGERERSTTATTGQVTIAGGPNGISTVSWVPLHATHKAGIAVESWRTAVAGAVFFKTTSSDPTVLANPNRYIENDPAAATLPTFNDELSDAALLKLEPHPENGDELEDLSPPAATLIVASDTRVFLAGVAGEPNRVWYSKLRDVGEIAAFNDRLAVQVPEEGGDITALAFLNETLVVFRETAVYALDGAGFDNLGGGQNFTPRLVSSDLGAASHEAICLTPSGLLFKSRKGWCLLNRGWAVDTRIGSGYVGAGVSDYDGETVHATHVVEAQHQVRIVTSARVLIWDYLVGAWAEWSIADGLHACLWNGTYHYLATAAVKSEQASDATADYGWDVEVLVHMGGLQGFARCRRIVLLGEVRGAGTVRFRVGTYAEGVYFDDKTWTISPVTVGAELEVQHGPSRQQLKAYRIRITSHATAGEKPKLTGLALEVGFKPGVFRHLPAAQRQ